MAKFLKQTIEGGEDERPVLDRFAEVAEHVSHGFQLAAEIGNIKVTLLEGVEVGGEGDGAVLTVAQELKFQGCPDQAGGGVGGQHLLEEVSGDGPVQPGEDDAVHLLPVGAVREVVVGEDVVGQVVFA